MIDHKYKVFHQLCLTPSTSQAAEILGLTQPAVSKSIRELEKELGLSLFVRTRNGMVPTESGKILAARMEKLVAEERNLMFELSNLGNTARCELKVGGSTTLAQYVLPPVISGFLREWPQLSMVLTNGNTQQIEEAVLNQKLHLAFIEGNKTRNDLHYIPYLKDELVLVCSAKARYPSHIVKEELPQGKFIFRERGSGTYHVIRKKMEEAGVDIHNLESRLRIGTTEGIKQYLQQSDAVALLSVYSIRNELAQGILKIIEIEDLHFERTFHAIHLQGEPDPYAGKFLEYALRQR